MGRVKEQLLEDTDQAIIQALVDAQKKSEKIQIVTTDGECHHFYSDNIKELYGSLVEFTEFDDLVTIIPAKQIAWIRYVM